MRQEGEGRHDREPEREEAIDEGGKERRCERDPHRVERECETCLHPARTCRGQRQCRHHEGGGVGEH